MKLCEEIGKEDVIWRISCRVKPLDQEMLDVMWQAGCRELSFGVESFDDHVLKGMKKNTRAKDNLQALEMAAKVGFRTRILFMIRTPFQTPETIEKNKYYIERAPFTILACTSFVPIPGSDIWFHPERYNIEILDRDLDNYNFYMYGPEGRRNLAPLIKIKDRSLESLYAIS